MVVEIGSVEALYRYPVKSMAGESLESAVLGWHGVEGDRRFAFRRVDDRSGFPWLTAGRLAELLLFTPQCDGQTPENLPTQVRTPEGLTLPLLGDDLAQEVGRRFGSPVEMMHVRYGIFDEGSVSLIALDTVQEVLRQAGHPVDVRRFRPNILVRPTHPRPFVEGDWVGSVLRFGEENDAPEITITLRDERCATVNFNPDSAVSTPEVLKAVVRANGNCAGVYGAVTRTGRLTVGQTIYLRATDKDEAATQTADCVLTHPLQ